MANAQHPRFQGTQRLNHASQRPLHASSQRFHVADVNSHPQQRTAQQSYGCDFRECGYDDGQWQRHGNSYDVHNWQPGGKGQARGMRLPMQTPPNNGYYPQQGEDHQQYQSRTPQEYAPLYQPEHLYKNRPKGHANGFQDDGGPTAYHNPSDNSDHACQNHSYGHNYDHRATPDGYGNGISQGTDTHGSIPGHPAAQMSSATTTQPNTAKSDFLPRTKPRKSAKTELEFGRKY